MAETTEYSPELAHRKSAAAAFVGSLVTSAKTAGLYAAGHPAVPLIAERVRELLMRTLGTETTLTLEIKAKTICLEEASLEETAETVAFASALHTLGVGQVVFTNRVAKEGMQEFFGVLTAKPEGAKTLTDLQKDVQQLRIDGLQMVFILTFVVAGETEEAPQAPGQLSEPQIVAFVTAATLPDYLTLWLHHTAELRGKEAKAIAELLEALLYQEISAEKFEQELPWDLFDARLRARWEEFRKGMEWRPKEGRARPRWRLPMVRSWISIKFDEDFVALRAHAELEKSQTMRRCLSRVRPMLDAKAPPARLKFASLAYARLIAEFGRDGQLPLLLEERAHWRAMEREHALVFQPLLSQLRAGLTCAEVAASAASALAQSADAAQFERLVDMALFLGERFTTQLVEQLRVAQDKDQRQRLCALLTAVCRQSSDKPLVAALEDEDWFLVSQAIGILLEVGGGVHVKPVAGLLKHGHRKVRDAAVKFLGKVGGPTAIGALAAFAAAGAHPEEVGKAVITLSLLPGAEVGAKLLEAFHKTDSDESRVALVRALSRFPSPQAVSLLVTTARRTWYEIVSGANKELREAARQSLEALRKEEKP